jgi:4-hydroxy-4-methyl-2-oxoglutarate aldolase
MAPSPAPLRLPASVVPNRVPSAALALPHAKLLQLKRWNTCTIANAIEQLSAADPLALVNQEETRDFMPEMGPMVGVAMTLVISGRDARLRHEHPANFARYREYLASVAGPKIVVVQDLDQPACHGSIWGEVGANVARALGCVGTITDGAIRDLDEMKNAGFKALARRLAVSHAHTWPVRWGGEVEVFGTAVKPGQLIQADKHGFIIIPEDAQAGLLETARFMDDLECETVIAAARQHHGRPTAEVLRELEAAAARFDAASEQQRARLLGWRG